MMAMLASHHDTTIKMLRAKAQPYCMRENSIEARPDQRLSLTLH